VEAISGERIVFGRRSTATPRLFRVAAPEGSEPAGRAVIGTRRAREN
jgi:hypothetical protein